VKGGAEANKKKVQRPSLKRRECVVGRDGPFSAGILIDCSGLRVGGEGEGIKPATCTILGAQGTLQCRGLRDGADMENIGHRQCRES